MESLEIEKNMLKLPDRIANKLRGTRIEITEIKEGILLKAVNNPIKEARGFLKGKRFTSSRYMQMKKCDHHEFDPIQKQNELSFLWIR